MNKFKYISLNILLLLLSSVAYAEIDDDQSDLRQNPNIESNIALTSVSTSYPVYIDLESNHIDMNGDDWSELGQKFAVADTCPVTIVHIGDSHLQADMSTAVMRSRMAQVFGDLRGRGLIVPFRLAGTNQPTDYTLTSTSTFLQSRLLKMPWPTEMGFTGIGICPNSKTFNLSLNTAELFNKLTIYYTGEDLVLSSAVADGEIAAFISKSDCKRLQIEFVDSYNSINLNFAAPAGTTIHGINAQYSDSGLAYHVIGNNGAAYSSYSLVGDMGQDVAMLNPDLVIISLGTNEAFGRVVESEIRMQIDALIRDIRYANPNAKILLTTPSECQRKITQRRRKRGRRRTYTSYVVNTKIKQMSDIIVAYGRDNSIPVYNWYDVAGGNGSSAKWLSDRYLNTDRIHLTQAGYRIQGNLFADALIQAIINPSIEK